MSAAPLVSVVLPVHNRPRHLAEAAGSILAQTLQEWEMIIVDDCSDNPETARIIADIAARDSRIRVIRRETNGGPAAARNTAIAAAAAPLVAFMDDDDISEPQRLEKQLAFLQAHPEVAAVACRKIVVNERGRFVRHYSPPRDHVIFSRPTPVADADGDEIPAASAGGFVPLNHTSAARRQCLLQAGGFRECYRAAEDHDMTFRFQEKFVMAELPDELYRYRLFRGERVSTSQDNWRAVIAIDISTRRRRMGMTDPMADGQLPDDDFIRAHFGELPPRRRLRFIGKFAGPARRLMRDGKMTELRNLLLFAQTLCADKKERRAFFRLQCRAAWWAAIFGQWRFWRQ